MWSTTTEFYLENYLSFLKVRSRSMSPGTVRESTRQFSSISQYPALLGVPFPVCRVRSRWRSVVTTQRRDRQRLGHRSFRRKTGIDRSSGVCPLVCWQPLVFSLIRKSQENKGRCSCDCRNIRENRPRYPLQCTVSVCISPEYFAPGSAPESSRNNTVPKQSVAVEGEYV